MKYVAVVLFANISIIQMQMFVSSVSFRICFRSSSHTWFNIQLRPLRNCNHRLTNSGLPEISGCNNDSDVDISLLGYDFVQVF